MFGKFALPIVTVGLAITLGVFSQSAMADPARSNYRVAVDYKGVDLTSAQGRQTFDRRVNSAIDAMCGQPVYGTRDETNVLRKCRRDLRAEVEPQVRTALITASAGTASPR